MTKKQIKFFQTEVVRYMDLFGLGRWTIHFLTWEQIGGSNYPGSDALSEFSPKTRLAKFSICDAKTMDDTLISRSALHEVAHILTARLEDYAYVRNVREDEVNEEVEAIAKAMERAFFGPVEIVCA